MRISDRELTLAVVSGAAVLIGVTILGARPFLVEARELRERQVTLRQDMEQDRTLAADKDRWMKEMDGLKGMLARFPAEQRMDVHWLSVMDRKAAQHSVSIVRRKAGEEKPAGEVFELPIECSDWEGSLDSLVHFLFELQSEGAMFDVRQLTVKPKGRNLFRGGFSLSCAYVKEGAKATSAAGDGRKPSVPAPGGSEGQR
jgi:hypothetical protein